MSAWTKPSAACITDRTGAGSPSGRMLLLFENPRVPASQLHGRKDQYKIKLRGAGYRLVYSVEDEIITVTVIGVGKRENDTVYKITRHRS